jgi:two-component system, cell cycle sensor histidine kinase and response regulator CckA
VVPTHGGARSMVCSGQALTSDAGEIVGAVVAMHDFTERKNAEEALRDSERRFQKMLGVVPDMISIQNSQMDILYSNWSGFGAVPESRRILNTKCYRTFRGFDDICPDCRAKSVLESGKATQEEIQLPDGSWFDIRVIPILEKDNHVEMFMEWVRDITERKQAEEELLAAKEKLNNILDNMIDVVWSISWPDFRHLYFSPSLEKLYGRSAQEFYDNPSLFKEITHPDDRHLTEKAVEKLLEQGEAERECRIVRPDGSVVWVIDRSKMVYDENQQPIRVDGVTHDITERKRAEEEREKLHDQLAQFQKLEAIGSLAGGVAHDLNNLLSPILGYGEMLRDDLDPEDMRRESVDEIIGAGLRARDLVRQLLAFSRKQILEFKPLNLNKIAAGLERLLRYTIREDIEMEFDLTPDAGVVMADIGQVEQVIMNLSVNAADAMPEGGELTIETQKVYLDEEYANHHTSVKPGEYAMLAVSDSGVGMDEATRERIFDPFFSTKGESGTGLGLATVYGIVKQHGGNIWVYSEPGKGSTFKVYLPVVETSEPEETTSAETIEDLKGSETILIVEDSDQVRRLAESVLKRNGYQVLTAKDGAQALEAMASHDRPVNLLLTDVVLPGMNGRELYEKAAESSPSLKVLYMSGYTDNVIAHRGVLDAGVQFIQKPFTVYGLAVKVREVLDEKLRK